MHQPDDPIAEGAVQLLPDGGVRSVDPANGGGRLHGGAAKGDGPATGQRMSGRERRMTKSQPEAGQVPAGGRRRHHRQGQEAGAQVVAEARQDALQGARRPADVLVGLDQADRPARLGQPHRRRQPVRAASSHHRVNVHHGCFATHPTPAQAGQQSADHDPVRAAVVDR